VTVDASSVQELGLGLYRYRVLADTRQYQWVSVGTNTSSPVIRIPVSTVNTVATHLYSLKPIPYFRAYTPHTYITCTHLYPTQNRILSQKKSVQPGIGIAAADSIGYGAPAQYLSNPDKNVFSCCQKVIIEAWPQLNIKQFW